MKKEYASLLLLKYPETFTINIVDTQIRLIPNVDNPTLLDLIKINNGFIIGEPIELFFMGMDDFTQKLISEVSEINYKGKKFKDISLSTHGIDIVIDFTLDTSKLIELPLEIFAIIYSYTNTTDVENLEFVIKQIYEDSKFWINLVNNKFYNIITPEYSISDYKKFYQGLCLYINYKSYNKPTNKFLEDPQYSNLNIHLQKLEKVRKLSDNVLLHICKMYPETIKYLLRSKQLDDDNRNKLILYIDDVDIFKIYIDDFNDVDHPNLCLNLLNNYEDLRRNIFDYTYSLDQSIDLLDILLDLVHNFYLDSDIINYIIDRIIKVVSIVNKDKLYQIFSLGVRGDLIKELWRVSRDRFTSSEIYQLNKITVDNYYSSIQYSTLNMFGEPLAEIPESYNITLKSASESYGEIQEESSDSDN